MPAAGYVREVRRGGAGGAAGDERRGEDDLAALGPGPVEALHHRLDGLSRLEAVVEPSPRGSSGGGFSRCEEVLE